MPSLRIRVDVVAYAVHSGHPYLRFFHFIFELVDFCLKLSRLFNINKNNVINYNCPYLSLII